MAIRTNLVGFVVVGMWRCCVVIFSARRVYLQPRLFNPKAELKVAVFFAIPVPDRDFGINFC